MSFEFQKGEAYIGTATIDKSRQKVFQVIQRHGDEVSFAPCCGVRREIVEECGGTEVAKIRHDDGFDYVLSARVAADVDGAFKIVKMCGGGR